MKVLAVCTYPIQAAATRYRLVQFVEPLADRKIELTVSPFLDSLQFAELYRPGGQIKRAVSLVPAIVNRVAQIASVTKYDVLLIQREAMLFGPAFFEKIYQLVGKLPLILDLDDATYVSYKSPNYGAIASYLKFFGKADRLIDMSEMVVCGNRFIADYVVKKGKRTVVIPTIADPNLFPQKVPHEGKVRIGWVGTKSTFPFLQMLFPVLSRLAEENDFVLKIIGSGQDIAAINNLEIENLEWSLEREIEDIGSFDIGLYPIDIESALDRRWLEGKSGFKAIQYMAAGVPFVMSPVGVCAEIGVEGKTHFNARSSDDWYEHLERLLSDAALRDSMGKAGHQHSRENYDLESHADKLANAFQMVVKF